MPKRIGIAWVCLLLSAAGCDVVHDVKSRGLDGEDGSVDGDAAAERSSDSSAAGSGGGGESGKTGEAAAGTGGSPAPKDAGASGAMSMDDADSGTKSPADSGMSAPTDSGMSAPADSGMSSAACPMPACTPNQSLREQQSCGRCGKGTQSHMRTCAADGCSWGEWSEWSTCTEPAGVECTPGDEQKLPTVQCGDRCGHASVKRVCTQACAWGAPVQAACSDEGECSPGTKADLPAVSCDAMCGRASQTHTCTTACKWGPPVSGACTGTGVCTPGMTRTVETGNGCGPCGKGIEQQLQTCNAGCAWEATGGDCFLPSNVCKPEGYEGSSGWHCVGDGQREWCYVAGEAPAYRCTWTGGREPYSGCP